jgi:hypothetical protein
MLWQLKKLSTNEALNEPQKLPENWGPIFGLPGIQDKLGDLSWLGENFADQGWVIASEEEIAKMTAKEVRETIEQRLLNTAWAVAADNVNMTKGKRAEWLIFRRELKAVPQQPGFPTNINWPVEPE